MLNKFCADSQYKKISPNWPSGQKLVQDKKKFPPEVQTMKKKTFSQLPRQIFFCHKLAAQTSLTDGTQ